jgi:hypothetical protein
MNQQDAPNAEGETTLSYLTTYYGVLDDDVLRFGVLFRRTPAAPAPRTVMSPKEAGNVSLKISVRASSPLLLPRDDHVHVALTVFP